MTKIIVGQVCFVLITNCLGMALMAGYDLLRLLRWLIPRRKVICQAEDIVYWMVAAIPAYGVFWLYNDGYIRWYGVTATLVGGLLYEKGISRPVRKLGVKILEKPKKRLYEKIGKECHKGKITFQKIGRRKRKKEVTE